ncbi:MULTISPECIES: prepilin-type N-terminal cleavage/methylation domain-containing protein [unclassified Yoonia]|uniref:prepilin-type N-terminal cleavage/methylation domain-containing protein n=1 Tax=unclassified Yoonia TaxID=2629118 RepID=UPI002AFDCA79|nr:MULTISPECIES: prepilin-type N-terminal cleavage/methylation domain-containing protein [unclassified Yoonia]
MTWNKRSGMTLLEVLVSLVLVAVIAVGIASSTNLGVQVLDRTDKLDQTNPQIALRTRLRHWLTAATPPSVLANFDTRLTGDATSMTFTTLSPTQFAEENAALQVNLFVAGKDLRLLVTGVDDAGIPITTYERVLAEDLANLSISYYTDDPTGDGWRGTWDDPNKLPILVRIVADEASTPEWPEFTVRLALAQER